MRLGKPLDAVAAEWRRNLEVVLRRHLDKPVLLSGGMDSATIVAGMIALGASPPCYSFRVGAVDNQDVRVSRKICAEWGLAHVVLDLPADMDWLADDVRRVIRFLVRAKRERGFPADRLRKTQVQCSQPILAMCERIAADGHSAAIVGTGAVCLDDRTMYVKLAREGEEAARDYRRDKMADKDRDTGTGAMHWAGASRGVPLAEPYSENPLRDFGLSLDVAELSRPRQKGIALRAYPDFYRKGYWRHNSSLQVNSGVREWHDGLLKTKLNRRGARRVIALYNDVLAEVLAEEAR